MSGPCAQEVGGFRAVAQPSDCSVHAGRLSLPAQAGGRVRIRAQCADEYGADEFDVDVVAFACVGFYSSCCLPKSNAICYLYLPHSTVLMDIASEQREQLSVELCPVP